MASSGNSTISSFLKYGKSAGKISAASLKARSTIVKNAVRSAIKLNKPTKYSKITGVKSLKIPTNVVDPVYKSSVGKFLSGEMRKAKKNFMTRKVR